MREELLARFRADWIEPPTAGRLQRMVRSALRTAERDWSIRIAGRLDDAAAGRLFDLIAAEDGGGPGRRSKRRRTFAGTRGRWP